MFFLYKMFNNLHNYIKTLIMSTEMNKKELIKQSNISDKSHKIEHIAEEKQVDTTQNAAINVENFHSSTNITSAEHDNNSSTNDDESSYLTDDDEYEFVDSVSSFFFVFLELKQQFDETYHMDENDNLFVKYYKNNTDKYIPLKEFADKFINQYRNEYGADNDILKIIESNKYVDANPDNDILNIIDANPDNNSINNADNDVLNIIDANPDNDSIINADNEVLNIIDANPDNDSMNNADNNVSKNAEMILKEDVYKFCLEQLINNILVLFGEYLQNLNVKQYILFDIDVFLQKYPLFEQDYNQLCVVELCDGLRNEIFRNFLTNCIDIC